jgi:hypothetical protein
MGSRQRRRARSGDPGAAALARAPSSEYRDEYGNALVLRGSLTAPARREYTEIVRAGLDREDAWQRAVELLFERLAVSWTISGLEISRQQELLGRYRMATGDERQFVRDSLRAHVGEHFPELEAP